MNDQPDKEFVSQKMKIPAILPSAYRTWPTHQQGMFWNLFWALAGAGGYLPFGSDTWKLSGALTRERWNASRSAVLAAFEFTVPDASGSVQMFYRPLLEIVEMQSKKLRSKKSQYEDISTDIHKQSGGSSLSLDLDFDLEKDKVEPKSTERCVPAAVSERMERERRGRLAEARKRGLRDYNKYPLEDWEKPSSLSAVAGD